MLPHSTRIYSSSRSCVARRSRCDASGAAAEPEAADAAARSAANRRLSAARSHSRALARQVEQRDAALLRMHTAVLNLRREVVELCTSASEGATTAAGAEAALALGEQIFNRVADLLEESDAQRVRTVDVQWTGAAGEVSALFP